MYWKVSSVSYNLYGKPDAPARHQALRHFRKLALAFLITNISLLYVQTDKIMLALLVGEAAVAAYTIPNYIVTSVYNIVISLFVVAIPRLTSLFHEGKKEEYRKLYNELVQAFLLVFMPLLVFIFLNAEALVTLYAAGKYSDHPSLKLFVVHIFSTPWSTSKKACSIYRSGKADHHFQSSGRAFQFAGEHGALLLGRFTPAAAVATLIVSYFSVALLYRIFIAKKISRAPASNFRARTYFLFSLPAIFVKAFLSRFELPGLAALALSFALFLTAYVILLILFKDRVFINNLKTSFRKVKAHLFRKKE